MRSLKLVYQKGNPSLSKPIDWQSLKPLPQSFFERNTILVAKDLLGKGLIVKTGKTTCACLLVEVEAYLGKSDPASHSFRGPTPRNVSMFSQAGTCYVYLAYGINHCMNVSTRKEGHGEAVLFRAALPLSGKSLMARRRGLNSNDSRQLMNGPGKMTQSLGIDLRFDGKSFDKSGFKLVDLGISAGSKNIASSPRIGISQGRELNYRFTFRDCPWTSRK